MADACAGHKHGLQIREAGDLVDVEVPHDEKLDGVAIGYRWPDLDRVVRQRSLKVGNPASFDP